MDIESMFILWFILWSIAWIISIIILEFIKAKIQLISQRKMLDQLYSKIVRALLSLSDDLKRGDNNNVKM